MLIFPAIDIKAGKVVRLFKGQFDKITEYGSDPFAMARQWTALGASYLHVVDLDGAQTGERTNKDIIKRMAQDIAVPLQTGGGIRSLDVIDEYLSAGVARVILGTKAVEDPVFLKSVLKKWGDRIAVSLDCSEGYVAQRGWVETSHVKGIDLACELCSMGLKYVIYTDIARDGTLAGPNINGLKEILAVKGIEVIASGGVKSLDDIKALLDLKAPNLYGVITGKAIYEGNLDMKAALSLTQGIKTHVN